MNNLMFIQKIAETHKLQNEDAIKIFTDGGKMVLRINGKVFTGDTLDQCVASIKESYAILYLEQFEMRKNAT